MVGFRTKNSVYYINQYDRTITGGVLKDKVYHYYKLQAIIGCRAVINLTDGREITTGIVLGYV